MNDFYKIGQVIEVRGQKLRIRVFENKNSNILGNTAQRKNMI